MFAFSTKDVCSMFTFSTKDVGSMFSLPVSTLICPIPIVVFPVSTLRAVNISYSHCRISSG